MIYIPQRIELADGTKCVALEDYDKLAVENMLEVNKICNQRDAAIDVLSKVSHFLSCGIGDENTTAKEFGDRIIDGFVDLSNRLGGERDLVEAEKTNLIKELKEAWFAMDEIEGTDRINKWQNKNVHLLGGSIMTLETDALKAKWLGDPTATGYIEELEEKCSNFEFQCIGARDPSPGAREFLRQTQELCHEYLNAKIKAERERNAAIDALMKIEDIFIDGDDTYEDWKSMGQIARKFLEYF